MTIRERFAKYTTKELENGVARLTAKVAEAREAMETFKAERNVEFYRMEEKHYNELVDMLLDAECALQGRKDRNEY